MRGKCERRGGNINADGAGAEVFVGDGCSQGASFGPIAAISRRGQGGRIYNNTRARVLLRRMCVKPAALTIHSPPKTSPRPHTATRPSRALPLAHAAPTHARRLRDAFPADRTTHSPPKTSPRPCTATRPSRALPLPHAAPTHAHAVPTHARRLRDARPPTSQPTPRRRPPLAPAAPTHARRLRDAFSADRTTHSPPKPFARPRTATRPSRALPLPSRSADTRPQAARCIPHRPHDPFPAEDLRSPPHSDTPSPSTSAPPRSADARPQAARCIPRRPHNPFPAAPRCLPFCSASGTKKRHRTVHVRCRMSRSTVVAVGHLGW